MGFFTKVRDVQIPEPPEIENRAKVLNKEAYLAFVGYQSQGAAHQIHSAPSAPDGRCGELRIADCWSVHAIDFRLSWTSLSIPQMSLLRFKEQLERQLDIACFGES